MEKKSILQINELPERAEKLSFKSITNVFGGCADRGEKCDKDSDCCDTASDGSFIAGCSDNNGPSGHKQCYIGNW